MSFKKLFFRPKGRGPIEKRVAPSDSSKNFGLGGMSPKFFYRYFIACKIVVGGRFGPSTPKSDFKIRQNWPSEFFIFINHASNWEKKRHFPAFPRSILLRDVKINIFSVFEWERKEDPYFTGYTIMIKKFR